ncbi:MAG: regulatory iron-sulfur-containing complex subunit RicT [bacterium]|nr:regulatory iron-sulfur-containing complex subunit RicT [bacterium]
MQLVGVKIKSWEAAQEFNPRDLKLKENETVVVETDQGLEVGKIVYILDQVKEAIALSAEPILRKAMAADLEKEEYYAEKRAEAHKIVQEKTRQYHLEMKLVDVHFAFDGGRVTFAFIAEGRIDFRDLLKDLTRHFQKSIRLQQVGSRDSARVIGGYGTCGREICCSRFLGELKSVTTDMARAQEMTHKGSEKNSGLCGRLKCCLAYEATMYEDLARDMPQVNETVRVAQGEGIVIGRNLLERKIKLRLKKDGVEIETAV